MYVPSSGQTLSILLCNLRALCEGFLARYTIGCYFRPLQAVTYLKSLRKRKFDLYIWALGCWVEVSVSNHLGYWESSHHLRGNDALSLMQRRRNKCIGAKVDIERNSLALPTFKTADRAEMRDYRFSLPRLFPYLPSDHRATVEVHYNKDSGSGLRKILLEHYFAKTNCYN